MKRPIESVVQVFGYRTDLGDILVCASKLEDKHPVLKTRLACFAEFAYCENDTYGCHSENYALDMCTNVILAKDADYFPRISEFEFDKAPPGAIVLCLFCETPVASIFIIPDKKQKLISFQPRLTQTLPVRGDVRFFKHLPLPDQRYYHLRDLTQSIFSSRQRREFQKNFIIPSHFPSFMLN